MPRMPRKPSGSGYYHVVSRGIGKQVLFEETEDYERYLETLRRFLPENSISLIAYCLMENHVHLLVHADSGLERAMKQIAVSYSYYFNAKYDRVGHLFQDRYMSEPVEDERYLLAAVRYIHNNPPKAGICPPGRVPLEQLARVYGSPRSGLNRTGSGACRRGGAVRSVQRGRCTGTVSGCYGKTTFDRFTGDRPDPDRTASGQRDASAGYVKGGAR